MMSVVAGCQRAVVVAAVVVIFSGCTKSRKQPELQNKEVVPKIAPAAAERGQSDIPEEASPIDAGIANTTVLDIVRKCMEVAHRESVGMHGAPLKFEQAHVVRPSDLRTRGEKGSAAKLSDEHRVVWIPESAPFDQIIPGGVSLTVNIRTGICLFPAYRR